MSKYVRLRVVFFTVSRVLEKKKILGLHWDKLSHQVQDQEEPSFTTAWKAHDHCVYEVRFKERPEISCYRISPGCSISMCCSLQISELLGDMSYVRTLSYSNTSGPYLGPSSNTYHSWAQDYCGRSVPGLQTLAELQFRTTCVQLMPVPGHGSYGSEPQPVG